jgi:hypothetical protein
MLPATQSPLARRGKMAQVQPPDAGRPAVYPGEGVHEASGQPLCRVAPGAYEQGFAWEGMAGSGRYGGGR